MKRLMRCAALAVALAGVIHPLRAESTPADPAAKVAESTAAHSQVLADLMAKLPEQAQAALEKALAASVKGRDAAAAALARVKPTETAVTPSTDTVQPESGTKLQHARDRVAASFDKSIQTLQGLAAKLPAQALEPTAAALERVQAQRQVALANLDLLISGLRPEGRSLDRPVLTERPARPERPERPQIPERPEAADRPERPTPPERPEPPA